jgi:hypothetical protein
MSNKLTEHGINQVKFALKDAETDVIAAKGELYRAENRRTYLQRVLLCEHNLKEMGGIEAVVTQCTKCGFSWYD